MADESPEDSLAVQRALARKQRKQEEMEEEMIRESGGEENVMVCIRVRPFNRRELELQKQSGEAFIRSVIEMPEGMGGRVVCLEKTGEGAYSIVEEFQYTKSFWSISEDQQPYPFSPVTQEDVFQAVGIPVIKYAFAGFHTCVFAYGQTGSGKTHSMMGDFSAKEGQLEGVPGLVPQLCKELFERIDRKQNHQDDGITKTIDVQLSAIEIYNEQVRDLFYKSTPGRTKQTIMKVRKHPTEGAFVDQLTVLKPKSWEQCLKLIETGVEERTVAATLMNSESSRSHSVFQITLTQTESVHVRSDDPNERFLKPVTNTRVSRINLVDLAGSERVKKSGAQGANLKEAATINQSLSTLKKVIDALVSNSKEPNTAKHIIIPFRESMLTMLLSHSLGGNSKTVMIACVSPHYDNQEETLLTLRYANRAKGIVNHTKVNEDDATKKALQLKHQILALQRRLEDGEDEEAEELKDQLEVGRLALREMERENQRLEVEAAQMKTRSKQEEGARFAAAFYNSVKMAMLKDQKVQTEASIVDAEQRLTRDADDLTQLQRELERKNDEAYEAERLLARLQREENDFQMQDMQQQSHTRTLTTDAQKAHSKLDSEMELRYAQKLVNARRLRKTREQAAQSLEQVQEENDVQLTAVILQAAEQYEQRVRRYADDDTHVQNRIRKAEDIIPKYVTRQTVAERETTALQQTMRQRERDHAARIDTIEADWKKRYADMKCDYETQIRDLEQKHYDERRAWDEELDDEDTAQSAEHLAQIHELETQIRTKETNWSGKVANFCADEAERMDAAAKRVTESSTLRVAEARHRFERIISDYVLTLRHLEAMCDDHDAAMETLRAALGPLTRPYEEIHTSELPHYGATVSLEYRALYNTIREYSSTYHSTPPRAVHHSGGAGGGYASPARRSGTQVRLALPTVEFFPASPARSTPGRPSSSSFGDRGTTPGSATRR